jgi:hypothetical protein
MAGVLAELSFVADDALYEREKPYDIIYADSSDQMKTNCRFQSFSEIEVTDGRPILQDFNLKLHGFIFML